MHARINKVDVVALLEDGEAEVGEDQDLETEDGEGHAARRGEDAVRGHVSSEVTRLLQRRHFLFGGSYVFGELLVLLLFSWTCAWLSQRSESFVCRFETKKSRRWCIEEHRADNLGKRSVLCKLEVNRNILSVHSGAFIRGAGKENGHRYGPISEVINIARPEKASARKQQTL